MCSCCRSFPCQCISPFLYIQLERALQGTVKSGWYIRSKAIHVIPLRAMCRCCRSFPCQCISIFLYTRSYITSSVARHTVKSGWYMAIRFVHLSARIDKTFLSFSCPQTHKPNRASSLHVSMQEIRAVLEQAMHARETRLHVAARRDDKK